MNSQGHQTNFVAGIDLGGTHMQIGVVDGKQQIRERRRCETNAQEGVDAVLDRLVRELQESCTGAEISFSDLDAVGIVAAGAVDIPRGVVLDATNLKWKNVPLRELLQERVGCPVIVDNDVNGAIWGEYCHGAGKDSLNLLGVWVGTGVGGGLVLNNQLYHGSFFTAGEIGHTILNPGGEPGRRTLEDFCSRTGLLHSLTLIQQGKPTSQNLVVAFHSKDPAVREIIYESARQLGIVIANWVTVLSLDTVILGGGVTESLGQPYVELIRASFLNDVFPDRCRDCNLIVTKLKADAGLLGAALLAHQLARSS